MKRDDIEKLLGGYATGTLTEEERRALFDAALSDQALFDALAGEEALREVLADPHCRRQINQALRPAPGFLERVAGWARRPHAWALAGSLAATAAIALLVIRTNRPAQPEIQLAQQNKVEAPVPPAPAAPTRPAAAQRKKKEAPAPAGAAGGVVGGIIPAQPAPSVPEQPPALADSREASVPPPPPSPPHKALTETLPPQPPPAAPAEQSKDVSAVTAGPGPVQFQAANRPEPPRVRTLGASVRQDAAAAPQIRYDVEVKSAEGQFIQATPGAPVAPGIPVRLIVTSDRPGSLSVFDRRNNLLFSTNAVAGARYTVTPPPAERKFTVVLTPSWPAAKTSVNTALRESVEKGKLPGGRVVTTIDLSRPRN